MAQSGNITGKVTDAQSGETVPGANVLLVEITRGTATSVDGDYTIEDVPVGTYTLRVSFVGYTTYEQQVQIQAGETLTHNVELGAANLGLDEVIVTGYGTQTKRELTGSISTVSSEDIEGVPVQNTESLLQGSAAGVTVTTTSGNPGGAFQVLIRGNGSINAASQPLYIVDGVQVSFSQQSGLTSQSPLNSISPSDIESIEVLKDASAAAIYGSQAANGVVLITTKRGQAGNTQVSVRAERGFTDVTERVGYLNTPEYLDYFAEATNHETGQPIDEARSDWETAFASAYGTPGRDGQLANFDWLDYIYQRGVSQNYNASVSGGDQRTRFYVSGGMELVDGHIFNSNFDRLNLRSNLDHEVSEKFNMGLNLNVSQQNQFGICQDGIFVNCPPSQAMFQNPMTFDKYDDGEYANSVLGPVAWNPAVIRDEVERNVQTISVLGNVNADYQFTDWLSFNGSLGADYRNVEDERYETPIARPSEGGSLAYDYRNVYNITANAIFNMQRTFNDIHNISGLVGTEYRRDYWTVVATTGEGFPGSFFKVLNASSTPTQAAGTNSEFRLGSYFANAKYNYNERYYLTLVGRYDGHSRFGSDTRWGFFPSISGAWRISEEDFFNVDFISDLKLRAGFGTTGNAAIGNFSARGLYSAVGSYSGQTALTPTQLANANLSWEEAQEVNLGLDFELWQGRLSGSVDAYQRDNENLLLDRELPSESGFGEITENVGSVRNEGIEVTLNSVNVTTRDFSWSTRFNIAFQDNEVLDLGETEVLNENSTFQELRVGQKIGVIQVPDWAGVNPADGRPMWYDADGNLTYQPNDVEDSDYYKDGLAEVNGGFGNSMSYKGLTLDVFFQFSFGKWAFANTDWYFTRTPDFRMQLMDRVKDRWKEPGDVTYVPRAMTGGAVFEETSNFRTTLATHSIYNASYIRLKNVKLSYTLPNSLTDKLSLGSARLFLTGRNVYTWTAWPFYDPEVADGTNDIYGNLVAASYPTGMQVNGGIEIRF
jgi:TonB-linked SusC/RagA family outer membrane protein